MRACWIAARHSPNRLCLACQITTEQLSALAFHELTTQLPYAVWLALPQGMGTLALSSPPLRVVRFSGKVLSAGVEEHLIEIVML